MTIPCDDLTVSRISRIDVPKIRIRGIGVVDGDLKKLGQAIDVGFGVSLATTLSAIAEDNYPRCYWEYTSILEKTAFFGLLEEKESETSTCGSPAL
jgi:hypothetical protein